MSGGNIRLNTNSISIDSGGAYAGRVGVNTVTPTTALDVNGGVKSTSLSTSAVSATGANNTISLAGDLSITASAPATGALSVAGALSVTGTLTATGTAIVNNLQGPTGQGPASTGAHRAGARVCDHQRWGDYRIIFKSWVRCQQHYHLRAN
ncbi:MAG: hypothetical protein EBZ77_10025 [Chitinophagia bacterium]|nr:hypothetical protein [Chitinophagia bacterium]